MRSQTKNGFKRFAVIIAVAAVFGFVPRPALSAEAEAQTASYQGLPVNEFMKTWLILGPLPVYDGDAKPAGEADQKEAQKRAFAFDFLTQHGGESGIQPRVGLTHQRAGQEYPWQRVRAKGDVVDLSKIFDKKEFAVAYAWAEIVSPEKVTALLGIGSDDAVKVWVNGKLVHENWTARALRRDDDLVSVELSPGKNQLLLKIQNGEGAWGFSCRALGAELLADQLVAAAAAGNMDGVQKLLSRQVNVNARSKRGLTAWQSAKIHGYKGIGELLVSRGANPQIPMPPPEQVIDATFKELTKGTSAGAAVLVAQNGKILFKKGYGYANLEHRVPILPETKFRIGSISKQFTAAAILQLQEKDKLRLQDPLSKFIPDYPRGGEVTLHHLLTHTSGIHSYTEKPDFLKQVTVPIKPEDLIKSFKDDPFDFSPGERWHYSNSGYFLLGYIVEKVSGEPLVDYLKKHLFEPLGMKNTGIHRGSDILDHEAAGYAYEDGEFKKATNWDMSWAGGAGALYSTVEDLYRWNEAVFGGQVLSEANRRSAFTPVKLNNGEAPSGALGAGYGYGWINSEFRGLRQIDHGGGLHGFVSYLSRYPEQNLTVVVLVNSAPPPPGVSPEGLAKQVAQWHLWPAMKAQEVYEVNTKVHPSLYAAYVGRYDYGLSLVLQVTQEGDRLFAQLTGQPKFEIFPKSETEFFWKNVPAQITFVKNEKGAVVKAIHQQGGRTMTVQRLEDVAVAKVDPALYDAYVGRYDLSGRAVLTISKENNRLFAQLTGQPKLEIFPKSETEFSWKTVQAQITFIKDDHGKVSKALLQQAGQKLELPKVE